MNDTNSEWQQSVLLEPTADASGHFIHGVFEGMPSDGEFSLYIASPCDPNSGEYVFLNKTYQQMMEPDQFEPFTPAPEKETVDTEENLKKEQRLEDLMSMWKKKH
ncbi:hypothetical protein P0Y67_21140 [Photobacterium sp. SP02]|uniref:hypothetical protein n=1 Tax=Photobacterium sp. SP02 TaxID=3032280 RepID=UPI0031455330